VRYNPGGDQALNRRQATRLNQLSDYLRTHGRLFLIELHVDPEPEQLEQLHGTKEAFISSLRPSLIIQAVHELQDQGVQPDVWKVEGLDGREDAVKVVAAVRRCGRDRVSCIVLGGGADVNKVRSWLATASSVPGFIGFAVGRTTFWEALVEWRSDQIDRGEAVARIARRYREWVDLFESSRPASARGGSPKSDIEKSRR
jgi:5-dehydro-2-deoxygluconokinase